jgi:hypothetical protein
MPNALDSNFSRDKVLAIALMKILTIGHSFLLTIGLVITGFPFHSGRSYAAELTITNSSFENPTLQEGVTYGAVIGWTSSGTGETETHNPFNGWFSGTSSGSPNSPIVGLNAANVNNGGKIAYQDSVDTNWIIKAGSQYHLTFLAGHRIGVPLGNCSVSFWAGTTLLSQTFPNPTEDTFSRFTLDYTAPSSGPVIGSRLRIEAQTTGADSQAWFDDFHLFLTNACIPHKATAVAELVNGVVVGATITDPGCGYTNAPLVLILGGGGSGATATAILANGSVAQIQVNNGGCCYTNAPRVLIASPPFVPTLEIRFSKAVVTQHVVLGRKYLLESSFDFVTWTPTGPSFIATSETIENEFDVNETGKYFRLSEVP